MKCKDIQSYGVCGKRVEFSLLDCYEASHAVERIQLLFKDYGEQNGRLTAENERNAIQILDNVSFLLARIAIKPAEMPNIFSPEEEEEDIQKES